MSRMPDPTAPAFPFVADPASYRALRRAPGARHIDVIDQRALPHSNMTARIADADAAALALLRDLARRRSGPVNVMTHCNAGALATCGWGTATAPLFLAHAEGLPLHVWVSETRPRLQGANLTAWEMAERGIPHTLFVDSASGLLLRRGDVDVVFVGADRVARNGDVCNKIGTYDKALAARDNRVPFYVALPSPSFDPSLANGDAIPIESRSADEVLEVMGRDEYGHATRVDIAPQHSRALNPAFDVTPARLVTGLITERGVARAAEWLIAMFPDEQRKRA